MNSKMCLSLQAGLGISLWGGGLRRDENNPTLLHSRRSTVTKPNWPANHTATADVASWAKSTNDGEGSVCTATYVGVGQLVDAKVIYEHSGRPADHAHVECFNLTTEISTGENHRRASIHLVHNEH